MRSRSSSSKTAVVRGRSGVVNPDHPKEIARCGTSGVSRAHVSDSARCGWVGSARGAGGRQCSDFKIKCRYAHGVQDSRSVAVPNCHSSPFSLLLSPGGRGARRGGAGVGPRAMCIEGLLNESKKEIIDNEGALKKKLKPARRFCLLSPALKLRW